MTLSSRSALAFKILQQCVVQDSTDNWEAGFRWSVRHMVNCVVTRAYAMTEPFAIAKLCFVLWMRFVQFVVHVDLKAAINLGLGKSHRKFINIS
jgi:hypothetical protein